MRNNLVLHLSILGVLAAAAYGQATAVDYGKLIGPPMGRPLAGEELDEATEALASIMRCPVCQGLSVADSPTVSALAMKQEVYDLLAAGYSRDQVLGYFESTYGEFIRLEPRAEGFNLLVWLAPVAAMLAGAILVMMRLRGRAAGAGAATATQEDTDLAEYRERVRREVGG